MVLQDFIYELEDACNQEGYSMNDVYIRRISTVRKDFKICAEFLLQDIYDKDNVFSVFVPFEKGSKKHG